MRKFTFSFTVSFLFILFVSISSASAQQMTWLRSSSSAYVMNPELPKHSIIAWEEKIFAVHLDSLTQLFGSSIYGKQMVDCYDSSGTLLWSNFLEGKALVECMVGDNSGNIFLAGSYMETVHLNNGDSLTNTGTGFNENFFIISYDANGLLRYKRNLSLTNANILSVSALAVDHSGSCWYAAQNGFAHEFTKLDATGNDLNSFILDNTRACNSFAFDQDDNIFIAGSTQQGTFTVVNTAVSVPETYMMFLTRINSSGQCSWVRLAHDVTFQAPLVVTTNDGGAFLCGNLMDSTAWGTVLFHGPQWVYDIFLTKVDSMGNFAWGAEPPVTSTITGDFQPGLTQFIAADDAGNTYILGRQRGLVDWGNGVVLNTGIPGIENTTLLSFDINGQIRWGFNGGSTNSNATHSVVATDVDKGYVSAFVNGTTTFGSLSTNNNGGPAFLLAKFDGTIPTGIKTISDNSGYSVFPNPVMNELHIQSADQKISLVQLFDITGRVMIENKNVIGRELSIPMNNLPGGFYVLKITDGLGFHEYKLVKN